MQNNNFTVDTSKWSMLALERAEYEAGMPMECEASVTTFSECVMDDYQGSYNNSKSYVEYREEDYSPDMMTRKEMDYNQWIKFINTRQGA